jgi:mono/diheme cytochrome c family protein
MKYPQRTDPLVTEKPATETFHPDPPGSLDAHIAKIRDLPQGKLLDPSKMSEGDRKTLYTALDKIFGKPAEPRVAVEGMEDQIKQLELDDATLAAGSRLYRRNCLHCHGVPGDGRGPTGPWVNPHPRDYRRGLFKFISTRDRPLREDLLRTLRVGIEGTTMPSFALLPEAELAHMVSYVIHLSIRGEVEYRFIEASLSGSTTPPEELAGALLEQWTEAYKSFIAPESGDKRPPSSVQSSAKSIENGYRLFTQKGDAGCIACHNDYGRQVNFKYDKWGTLVRPANLTLGAYRGGRRPIDIYWRIRGGIDPSGMQAFTQATLTEEQAWDLVNFVQALPYPNMLPEEVRRKVYGGGASRAHAETE